MKLESRLPERPGFLHALPLFDLFALLLLFFLLGPLMTLRSGVSVEPPPSRFQLERYEESRVITLGPGDPEPRLYFGREPLDFETLGQRLDELREEGASPRVMILLQVDGSTPVAAERQVAEMVLERGFRLGLVGRTVIEEPGGEGAEAVPEEPDEREPEAEGEEGE